VNFSPILGLMSRLTMFMLCLAFCLTLSASPLAQAEEPNNKLLPANNQPTYPASIESMPRLGIEALAIDHDAVLQGVADSGAGLVRVQISWASIEPVNTDPANYNWSAADALFARLAARNLSPLVTVLGCPAWACVRDNGPLLENRNSDIAQFMGALASRYSSPTYKVHYWEMWNEPDGAGGPNNQWGWGMHPDKYALMLSWVYPAMKAADPQSALISGGLAYDNWFHQGGPFNPDFLPGLLNNGGARYLDAIAFHYYPVNAHGWTNIGLKTAEVRAVMNRYGVNLPLICTEGGWTSDPNYGSSEQLQAQSVVKMNVQGAASGLRAHVWYLDRDYFSPNPGQELFSKFGLMRTDNSRKPAHAAMRVLAQEIGSGPYLRQLGTADGVAAPLEGYHFRRGTSSRHVSVVWNKTSSQAALTIPALQVPDLIRVVDMYGQRIEAQPGQNGTLLLSVSADPLYIEWGGLFEDVPASSWMYPYVEYLVSRGIVSGYADNTFRPGNEATRGQFSKMIVLGMGWPVETPANPQFADVPRGHTFYGHIETAYRRGLIGGYECGGEGEPCPGAYFRPGNNITRGQIAKIVVRAKDWPLLDPPQPTFSDVPPGSTFYTYVETVVAHGIASGYNDRTFRPGNSATRAQLSKMLALALQQP